MNEKKHAKYIVCVKTPPSLECSIILITNDIEVRMVLLFSISKFLPLGRVG